MKSIYQNLASCPFFIRWCRIVSLLGALSGCASFDFNQSIHQTNQRLSSFTESQLVLAQTQEQRETMNRAATELLKQPLTQTAAVQLALTNSPSFQVLLAQYWSSQANITQEGRLPNPIFTFERIRFVDEVEFGRLLAFGLLDLLTLPQRTHYAQQRNDKMQLQMAIEIVDLITQVRQSWVNAVAAQQNLKYAKQVLEAAQASSKLAQRLQERGNFSKLAAAQQRLFYADAITQWSVEQHHVVIAQEKLTRLLGLTEQQVQQFRLPEKLPELPLMMREPEEISQTLPAQRLDIQMAYLAYTAAVSAQGLNRIASLTDIELGVRHNTKFDHATDLKTPGHGYEISVRLPLFDNGTLQREAMNAQTLAAVNQLEEIMRSVGSHVRENYSAYRTAYDIAKHYQNEVTALHKTITEESLLRYNGMLIGVFDLLREASAQIKSVKAAITAEQQFWLADAALQATLIGKPMNTEIQRVANTDRTNNGEQQH